jgi:hypothetical protein
MCVDCRTCVHELVLNRVCYFCGQRGVQVTVAPTPEPVVPAARLRARRPEPR